MKVKATKVGYFGKLRDVGDEFEVPEGTKKATWFDPVEAEKPAKQEKAEKPAKKSDDEQA